MKDLSNENVIHIKNGKTEYLQFRKLLEYRDILEHAYVLGTDKTYRTSRDNGSITQEEINNGMKNYEKFCNEIGLDYRNLVTTFQAHTDNVEVVNDKSKFNLDNQPVDGICTNIKDNILATVNADCILLMFFDPVKKVIANTHSGWRGTLQRISAKTVDKMIKEYNCNPEDIICCICPSIRKCHFEVEQDVRDKYIEEFQDLINIKEIKDIDNANTNNLGNIIEETVLGKKWHIDTVRINEILLENKGLKKENIIDSGICSVCNSDIIHSFRVEGKGNGLSTAIIGLK